MLQMLRDLVAHKKHMNAALLNAIRQHAAAAGRRQMVVTTLTMMRPPSQGIGRRRQNRRSPCGQTDAAGAAIANGFSSAVGPYTEGTDWLSSRR